MIHVVFQHADVAVLKKAIELDASLEGMILEIRDEFAVGPLQDLETEEGWTARQNWWKNLLDMSPYASENLVGSFDDRNTVDNIKQLLQEDKKEALWIWMGQNQHDVCGYYWLIGQLKEFSGRVVVLYFNNLPFINEKGQIFYPTTLHQILPKEFLKAKKLNRKVTPSEFEVDPDEWKRLSTENALVRILEGGKKIVGKDESYYDNDVLNGLSPEWQKGNRAMHSILAKMKNKTGDVFLLWRLRVLAEAGRVDLNGDTAKGWKDFEVKLKTSGPVELMAENADASV
ncbi:MAG TPA: DUF1835 domain-containing protein [Flavisolibacter sp.]|nr:DUF1835 domain-containing protein [Flavisolibacter sp.]